MNPVGARRRVAVLALCTWSGCLAVSAALVPQYPTGKGSVSRGCGRSSTTLEAPAVLIELGNLNRKAISFPLPKHPRVVKRAGIRGVVTVRVVVEANSGLVVWAGVVSGPNALRDAALAAACCARFVHTNDVDAYVGGTLIYRFGKSSK